MTTLPAERQTDTWSYCYCYCWCWCCCCYCYKVCSCCQCCDWAAAVVIAAVVVANAIVINDIPDTAALPAVIVSAVVVDASAVVESCLCCRYGICADGLMCSNCNRCQGCSFQTFMCWDDKNCIWWGKKQPWTPPNSMRSNQPCTTYRWSVRLYSTASRVLQYTITTTMTQSSENNLWFRDQKRCGTLHFFTLIFSKLEIFTEDVDKPAKYLILIYIVIQIKLFSLYIL